MTHDTDEKPDGTLRVRLSVADSHYREHLIPAATILRLFADCSTEIGLRESGMSSAAIGQQVGLSCTDVAPHKILRFAKCFI